MTNILHISSSPRGEASFSQKLSCVLLQKLTAEYKTVNIVKRNLAESHIPFLRATQLRALFKEASSLDEAEKESLRCSDMLIREIQEADVIVIAIAMYNLSLPACLKAWLDQIVRINVTFRSTGDGKKTGLLHNKRVFLAIASGRVHSTRAYEYDFIETYLRIIFRSIGLTDVHTYRIEGTAGKTIKEVDFSKIVMLS